MRQPNTFYRLFLSDFSWTERKKRNVDGGRNALSLFSTFTRDDVRQDSTGESERRKERRRKARKKEKKKKRRDEK